MSTLGFVAFIVTIFFLIGIGVGVITVIALAVTRRDRAARWAQLELVQTLMRAMAPASDLAPLTSMPIGANIVANKIAAPLARIAFQLRRINHPENQPPSNAPASAQRKGIQAETPMAFRLNPRARER